MAISLAICGACGRMAGQVLRRAYESKDFDIVAAIDSDDSPSIGSDAGYALGIPPIGVNITPAKDLKKTLQETKPQILVEFTTPEASVKNARVAAELGIDYILGTTGMTKAQLSNVGSLVKNSKIRAIISPNFSVCVNLFFKLAKEAAELLDGYDIELIEAHHRFKKDSPSGTGKKILEAVMEATDRTEKDLVHGRVGLLGERSDREIGVHSIKAGDIVGDHTLLFSNIGERFEIRHQAHSRDTFAFGCLRAAKWLAGQKPGLYDMFDVLDMK